MEHLEISGGTKEEKYRSLLPQLKALAEASPDLIAAMANFSAAIHETFGFLWTGFYRVVDGESGTSGARRACNRGARHRLRLSRHLRLHRRPLPRRRRRPPPRLIIRLFPQQICNASRCYKSMAE